jgi:hypothetical protein
MFFWGGAPIIGSQIAGLRPPAPTNEGARGPYRYGVNGTKMFFRAMGRMCATSSSVDFIDGDGNKTPRTVRSQIVPPPALTSLATQASTLLGNLSDLLPFSIQLLQLRHGLYLCYTRLNESISL